MPVMIGRALNMLKSQIAAQGDAFEQKGGFSERLVARRLAAREEQWPSEESPQNSPLKARIAARGCGEGEARRGNSGDVRGTPNARGRGS
jgi:restriction system protein